MLKAGVLAFSILPDDDDINILVARREALEIKAVDEGSVEVKVLAKLDVEGVNTTADGGLQATLKADLVLADGIDDLLRDVLHIPMNVVFLEVYGSVHGLHDLLDGAGHQGSDTVTGNKGDGTRSAVAGARHVGDGSATEERVIRIGGAGEIPYKELLQDR